MSTLAPSPNPLFDFHAAYMAKRQAALEAGEVLDEDDSHHRLQACRKSAWAVPTPEAIEMVCRFSPAGVVSMGAGLGYWEHFVQAEGVPVIAFDRLDYPNRWCAGIEYLRFPVRRGEPPTLRNASSKRTLLLCWPPHNSEMAADALKYYAGKTVVYVGEPAGRFCAEPGFFRALEAGFECVERVALPSWPSAEDDLSVWVKR